MTEGGTTVKNRSEADYDKGKDTKWRYLFLVQDFYIELLGAFIPGFLFVISTAFVVVYFYYYVTLGHYPFEGRIGQAVSHGGVWLFFVCLSYAFGSIFYRMPPKRVDSISYFRHWATSPTVERRRLAVQYDTKDDPVGLFPQELAINFFACAFGYHFIEKRTMEMLEKLSGNVKYDYPYPSLRVYLLSRGFSHLVTFVPWCANSGVQPEERSKHMLNIIKQRIRSFGDDNMILDMIRNEGQIRLLSSLWFVFLVMRKILVVAVLIGFCFMTAQMLYAELWGEGLYVFTGKEKFWTCQCFFLAMFFSIGMCTWFKWKIESSINYVRVREVVMILESAHLADRGGTLFSDLKAHENEFVQQTVLKSSKCRECPCFAKCGENRRS